MAVNPSYSLLSKTSFVDQLHVVTNTALPVITMICKDVLSSQMLSACIVGISLASYAIKLSVIYLKSKGTTGLIDESAARLRLETAAMTVYLVVGILGIAGFIPVSDIAAYTVLTSLVKATSYFFIH